MSFLERLNNIYAVDTKMWGLGKYMAAYLVKGKELALIDTGVPSQLEAVRAGIKAWGFSISDISSIFVTHEHSDHSGNVAPLLREAPKASVYINPIGEKFLTDPMGEAAKMVKKFPTKDMRPRSEEIQPVPKSRIKLVKDGQVFDLGDGEKLRVIFTPGHQPGGIVLYEEKNKGLFINDLAGLYLADADAAYPFNSYKVDHIQGIASLKKILDLNLPMEYLYFGHYGIVDKPKQVINRAIKNMQGLLDIGTKYMKEGKPELIAEKAYAFILPEMEKLRPARGETVYKYATQDHVARQVKLFAQWCQERLK